MSWFKSQEQKSQEMMNQLLTAISIEMDKLIPDYYAVDLTRESYCKVRDEIIDSLVDNYDPDNYHYFLLQNTVAKVLETKFANYRIDIVQKAAKERILSKLTYGEKAILLSINIIDWISLEKELNGEMK